jgi:hypothetical protein
MMITEGAGAAAAHGRTADRVARCGQPRSACRRPPSARAGISGGRSGRACLLRWQAAAARFLAAPKRERFVYQATLDAIDFIQGRAKGDTV